MRQSIAILSLLSSAVMAVDTIPFYFPGGPAGEGVDPVATIKKVAASTTEFSVSCPTGVDSTECGWGPGLDYTIISATHYQAQMSADSVSMSYACDHNTAASEMTCTVAMTGGNMDMADPQTAVLSGTDIAFNTATILKGAEMLTGGAAVAQSTGASASGSGAAAQSTGSAAAKSGLQTDASPSATGSRVRVGQNATSSAQLPEHTGAATRFGLEASALFVLAGAVVLNVL